MPTHCALNTHAGLDSDSIALLEQIRTIDKRRLKGYVGSLGRADMQRVNAALAISVGLNGRV